MRRLALLAIAALALAAGPARAQVGGGAGVSARLSWARLPGAERCPSGRSVRGDVSDRLGYDPFGRPAPTLFVDARVRPAPEAGFAAELVFRRADGTAFGSRRLDAADCDALGHAAALAMAVTLDPEAALLGAATPRRGDADPGAGAPVDPGRGTQRRDGEAPPRARASSGEPAAPGPAWSASLRLDAAWGALPVDVVAAGPGLAVGVRLPVGLRLGAGAWWLPERSQDGVAFALAAGWVEACAAPELAPGVQLAACARAHLGAHLPRVEAQEGDVVVAVGDDDPRLWAAAGPALALRVALPARLFAELEVGALFGMVRNRWYGVETGGDRPDEVRVYREPPGAVTFAGAVGIRLD